jgi:hypothetical protein
MDGSCDSVDVAEGEDRVGEYKEDGGGCQIEQGRMGAKRSGGQRWV